MCGPEREIFDRFGVGHERLPPDPRASDELPCPYWRSRLFGQNAVPSRPRSRSAALILLHMSTAPAAPSVLGFPHATDNRFAWPAAATEHRSNRCSGIERRTIYQTARGPVAESLAPAHTRKGRQADQRFPQGMESGLPTRWGAVADPARPQANRRTEPSQARSA